MMNEPVLGGMAQTTLDRPDPLLRMGNTNCGGCGLSSLMQMMRHATADQRVHLVVPACCAAVSAGNLAFPAGPCARSRPTRRSPPCRSSASWNAAAWSLSTTCPT